MKLSFIFSYTHLSIFSEYLCKPTSGHILEITALEERLRESICGAAVKPYKLASVRLIPGAASIAASS